MYELDPQNQDDNGNKNESNIKTPQISPEKSNDEISNEPTDEAPITQQNESTETPSQEKKMSHMLRLP